MDTPDPSEWITEDEIVELLRSRAPDISWVQEIPDLSLEEIRERAGRLTPEQRAKIHADFRMVVAQVEFARRHQDREDTVRGLLVEHGVDPGDGITEDDAADLLQALMDKVREWATPALVPDAVTLLALAVETLERIGCQFDMCPGPEVDDQPMMTCHACSALRRLTQAVAAQPDPFV